jgi:hypothetical protein
LKQDRHLPHHETASDLDLDLDQPGPQSFAASGGTPQIPVIKENR